MHKRIEKLKVLARKLEGANRTEELPTADMLRQLVQKKVSRETSNDDMSGSTETNERQVRDERVDRSVLTPFAERHCKDVLRIILLVVPLAVLASFTHSRAL